MNETNLSKPYRDFYFRLVLSLGAAHAIVVFGEQRSLSQLLLMPEYYISVLGSFLIAFILVSMVRWLTIRLDRNYDWMGKPLQRTALQILLVVVAPGLAAFLLATLYFTLQGISILNTVYLRFDFPVIILMLVLLNAYYIAYYFYLQAVNKKANEPVTGNSEEQSVKAIVIVSQGTKNIPLPVEEISYFFRAHEINYARTSGGTDYMITQSLDEVQEQLDNRQFFRANRQMLVNFKACDHFELLPYGKLQLVVQPGYKEPVIISQKRAKQFKEWMER
jgi:Ca2+/Na+ antiporter